MYEVVIDEGHGKYAFLRVGDICEWKTRRTAEKHASAYRRIHSGDAWVNPIYDKQGNATIATYGRVKK
jgi:formylglycine-generating enzyme required for sulfatase activity